MNTLVSTLTGRFSGSLSSWTRDRRGSVTVEFVIGSVLLVTATVGGLYLYRTVETRSLAAHAATAMADYVSLEETPSEAFIEDLARFLHRNEIAIPSQAAFVVSAVGRSGATDDEPDPPVVVHWDREIAVGEDPESPPVELAESCGRLGDADDEGGVLPALGMEPGEMVIVVEVCVALPPGVLLAGRLFPTFFYQQQILPVRGDHMPEEPS